MFQIGSVSNPRTFAGMLVAYIATGFAWEDIALTITEIEWTIPCPYRVTHDLFAEFPDLVAGYIDRMAIIDLYLCDLAKVPCRNHCTEPVFHRIKVHQVAPFSKNNIATALSSDL